VLSQHSIGAISAFLLEYYRDAFAPVDHIDIEMSHIGQQSDDVTLIIRASNFVEPMPGEEAK